MKTFFIVLVFFDGDDIICSEILTKAVIRRGTEVNSFPQHHKSWIIPSIGGWAKTVFESRTVVCGQYRVILHTLVIFR